MPKTSHCNPVENSHLLCSSSRLYQPRLFDTKTLWKPTDTHHPICPRNRWNAFLSLLFAFVPRRLQTRGSRLVLLYFTKKYFHLRVDARRRPVALRKSSQRLLTSGNTLLSRTDRHRRTATRGRTSGALERSIRRASREGLQGPEESAARAARPLWSRLRIIILWFNVHIDFRTLFGSVQRIRNSMLYCFNVVSHVRRVYQPRLRVCAVHTTKTVLYTWSACALRHRYAVAVQDSITVYCICTKLWAGGRLDESIRNVVFSGEMSCRRTIWGRHYAFKSK